MLIFSLLFLVSCQNIQLSTANQNKPTQSTGELSLVANGEDFVRQGFTSKDGWKLKFDHLYLNLAQVTVYQTNPPFNSDLDQEIKFTQKADLLTATTKIDLAEGDENSPPILVNKKDIPSGNYNALSWELIQKDQSDNYTIFLQGLATKANQNINFSIKFNQPVKFLCGEYVGEERKGIVKEGTSTEAEITLHFDHLFGNDNMSPKDEINQSSLGFEPFAKLAQNDQVEVDQNILKNQLDSLSYQRLQQILTNLGHVGEGHCKVNSR